MSEKKFDVSGKLLIVLCLVILLFSLSAKSISAQVSDVTLKPTDDTYLDSSNPNSNYGEQNYLQITNYNSEINIAYESIVWLKFNLSSVPDGAVIDGATLQLRTSSVNGSFNVNAYSGSNFLNVSAVVSWTESTLTYSDMPSYNTTSMSSVLVETSGQWYNWSVVDAARDALNSRSIGTAIFDRSIVTLVLYDPSPHGLLSSISFNSKESSISDYAPTLTVHWTGRARGSTDLNNDGVVDIIDITIVAKAFGSHSGSPNWNPTADLNHDGIVNILDLGNVAVDFGKTHAI
jgi:hypothetical protein